MPKYEVAERIRLATSFFDLLIKFRSGYADHGMDFCCYAGTRVIE